jgi:hypothetical protein
MSGKTDAMTYVELGLGNLRSLLSFRVELSSKLAVLGNVSKCLQELIINAFLDVNSGSSIADCATLIRAFNVGYRRALTLSSIVENSTSSPFNGLFQISIVKNDAWALSSKLQAHGFQVAVRSGFGDLSANQDAASECNLVDSVMLSDVLSYSLPITVDNVENAGREPGLLDQFAKLE